MNNKTHQNTENILVSGCVLRNLRNPPSSSLCATLMMRCADWHWATPFGYLLCVPYCVFGTRNSCVRDFCDTPRVVVQSFERVVCVCVDNKVPHRQHHQPNIIVIIFTVLVVVVCGNIPSLWCVGLLWAYWKDANVFCSPISRWSSSASKYIYCSCVHESAEQRTQMVFNSATVSATLKANRAILRADAWDFLLFVVVYVWEYCGHYKRNTFDFD